MLILKFIGECNRTVTLEIDEVSNLKALGINEVCILKISDERQEILISRTAKEMKLLLMSLKNDFFSHMSIDGITIDKTSSSRYDFENGEVKITISKIAKAESPNNNFERFCEKAIEIINAL